MVCFYSGVDIQERNRKDFSFFEDLFGELINVHDFLFDGSACVFPGVRRYVSGEGKRRAYNEKYMAIIDDNTFPRHIWCFLSNGLAYSGPNWKKIGLNEFELAHIFSHKKSELDLEKGFFNQIDIDANPLSNFTCACNVALLPKGTVRPTDNSKTIKAAYYQRHINLYGDASLQGHQGFNGTLAPDWFDEINWNEPILPDDWQGNIVKLLDYRSQRISQIVNNYRQSLGRNT